MRYLVYARKSSESEDRQAQSIEDQRTVLRSLADQRGLLIVGEYAEARSAKAPGTRPVFEEVINLIQRGEADALLCWHVNRLFRNPVDFGKVSWLLQTGALEEILTPHQVYRSTDNVLLLSVESGMANQYIIDLRNVVERAIKSKIEQGIPPQVAPEGYRNNLYTHIIEPDPERFPLIRKAWDLMLTGAYTVPQVLDVLNGEWGYRTKAHRKIGGTPMSRPSGYRMFNNLFYTGYFLREGAIHKGAYPPMVTLDEYERVQDLLSRQGNTQPKKRVYAYTGLIRCGRCGCMVTAEVKKGHLYYHCTNARRVCSKRGITQEALERQVKQELRSIRLHPQIEALLRDIISRFEAAPREDLHTQHASVSHRLQACEEEMGELVIMRARRLIDDVALVQGQQKLRQESLTLRKSLARLQEQLDRKPENVVTATHFAAHAVKRFEAADTWAKRRIVQVLGGSYLLTEKTLTIEKHPLLHYIAENRAAIERAIIGAGKQKEGTLQPSVSLGGIDETLAELFRLGMDNYFPPDAWEQPCPPTFRE